MLNMPQKQARKFRIGYYFDMFSFNPSDWQEEAEFNLAQDPEHLEVMFEIPSTCANFDGQLANTLIDYLPNIPLSAHAPSLDLSIVALNDHVLQASINEYLAAIDAAQHLGAKLLTLHAGSSPFIGAMNDIDPAKIFCASIKPIIEKAKKYGIQVLVENMGGGHNFPSMFEEIDAALLAHSELMLALDTRHFCQAGLDPTEGYKRYHGRVKAIQFRLDGRMTNMEIKTFLETLLQYKYDGIFIIEDKALTCSDKKDKSQLLSGKETIFRLLNEIGVA